MSGHLRVQLDVADDPEGSRLEIRATVENRGGQAVDTRLWASRLLVDGSPSDAWAWAIANGIRAARESALEPSGVIEVSRVFDRQAITPSAGEHELVLEVSGVLSDPVRLLVDANRTDQAAGDGEVTRG